MTREFVCSVCSRVFAQAPTHISRFSTGLDNYVFHVTLDAGDYVFRCGTHSYENTLHYLAELQALELPVSRIIAHGREQGLFYMVTTYLPGQELGSIYPALSKCDKQTIAKEVVSIQARVATLQLDTSNDWRQWVRSMLARAKGRITANGYFDPQLVDRLLPIAADLDGYFESLQPLPYLDDITTKNLLIQNGHVSGIIDVDWLECGDRLTFAALTYTSLLNLEYDTDYVQYLLEQLHITPAQRHAFQFYALLYCVDFMGERGSTFAGRTVPVSEEIVTRLNRIYVQLWSEFQYS